MLKVISPLIGLLVLGGCTTTSFDQNAPLPEGPKPVVMTVAYDPLACVANSLTSKDRGTTFTVGEFADKTGKLNTNGGPDATGSFNTQGGESMLYAALGRTGVETVIMTSGARALADWQIGKQGGGSLMLPNISIGGSISSTDIDPGSGADISIGGIGGSSFQNRILNSIDLWAYYTPATGQKGGVMIGSVTITKQVVQDGVELKMSRFVGGVSSTYVALDAGRYRREPLQFSTRAMLELGLAQLLTDVYKKGQGCLPSPAPTRMAAAH